MTAVVLPILSSQYEAPEMAIVLESVFDDDPLLIPGEERIGIDGVSYQF